MNERVGHVMLGACAGRAASQLGLPRCLSREWVQIFSGSLTLLCTLLFVRSPLNSITKKAVTGHLTYASGGGG